MYHMSMNDRQISQLEIVKTKVRQLLGGDTSGHADDHVERVALLTERFANECSESVNLQEVLLTAWLHDVDDYKLVGKTQAENRQQIMVDFLRAYFREKNAPEWSEFLEEYLRSVE